MAPSYDRMQAILHITMHSCEDVQGKYDIKMPFLKTGIIYINGSGDVDTGNICTRITDIAIEDSGNIIIERVIEQRIEKH